MSKEKMSKKKEETMSQGPMSLASMSQESKRPEIKLDDVKQKPVNLRANVMPVDGHVLSIDGKLKSRYESAEDAMAAGVKLKQSYPMIQVSVYDACARIYTPVNLPDPVK
jgi:hypothetical protein